MKRKHGIFPSGFAQVDVVVASGLAAFSLMLAVPALQNARDAARRQQCTNNLKQIGIACHNYHDTYMSLPGAWYARYHQADSVSWTGWQVALLPYMEEAPIYDMIRDSQQDGRICRAPEWPQDKALAEIVIPMYRCPADTTNPKNEFRGGFAASNYSGNAGTKPFPRIYAGLAEEYWPGGMDAPVDPTRSQDRNSSGVFHVNSRTRLADIIDGCSSTLMVTERSAISGAGIWMGVRSNRMDNDVVTEFSHLSRINKSLTGASSFHTGGLNFLLCDGSVRFVSEDIESGPTTDRFQTLQALAGRRDGQFIDEF